MSRVLRRRLNRRYGRAAVSKPGQHGTLYRYVITYTDKSDPGFGEMTWHAWAYNLEHAEEKFFDQDEGFSIVNIRRLQEGLSQHRAVRHPPRGTL
jgi:hypothetical protein